MNRYECRRRCRVRWEYTAVLATCYHRCDYRYPSVVDAVVNRVTRLFTG